VGRDVFISYAEEDKTAAALACKRLEDVGVSCWMAPRDILPGRTWAASIMSAIESCRAMVLVLSAHSAASRQVAREVERADALHLPLVTIRLDAAELSGDLEYFLSNTQWLDASSGRIEDLLAPLPRYVRMLLASPSAAPPRAPSAGRGETATRELRAIAASWFAVLARRHDAVMSFALQEPGTLMFALRFGFYMVLAGAVISFPVVEAARRRPLTYLLAYIVSGIVEIAGTGMIVHGAFRVMGGRAALTSSIAAWCLYLAFWPVLAVSLAPVNVYVVRALEGQPFSRLEEWVSQLPAGGLLALLVCFAVSTVAVALFARGVFRTFRALHGLARVRSLAAALLAISACAVFLAVIAFPFARSLYW
jgi:hypothetical protein